MEMHGSSHGSGRGQHLRHFTIGVLLLGALALIAVYVWTAPVGFVWHLFHGNFTSFDGQRIPVPGDMWAHLADNGGLTIMREARATSNRRKDTDWSRSAKSPEGSEMDTAGSSWALAARPRYGFLASSIRIRSFSTSMGAPNIVTGFIPLSTLLSETGDSRQDVSEIVSLFPARFASTDTIYCK